MRVFWLITISRESTGSKMVSVLAVDDDDEEMLERLTERLYSGWKVSQTVRVEEWFFVKMLEKYGQFLEIGWFN